jgi:hypothetical protein
MAEVPEIKRVRNQYPCAMYMRSIAPKAASIAVVEGGARTQIVASNCMSNGRKVVGVEQLS